MRFSTFQKLHGGSGARARIQFLGPPMFLSLEVGEYRREKRMLMTSERRMIACKIGPEINLEIQQNNVQHIN